MPSYNLLDERWIPCQRSTNSPAEELSIREVFAQAPRLVRISDPAPTVTAALHRLLLAILHRSLDGPRSPAEWGEIWRHGAWDMPRIDAYLRHWRDRFDLFSPDYPFYQTTELSPRAFRDVTQLTHERASDRSRPLLFDYSLPGMGLSAAASARYLVAQQAFSVAGMFSTNPGEGATEKFAGASPLARSAVCLVAGASVFETLMLNWYLYDRESQSPFPFAGDDRPAWERDEPVFVTERVPDGWVDLLTWQSRRILLRPAQTSAPRATEVALMQGYRLAADFDLSAAETMVAYMAFTPSQRPQRSDPLWLPIGVGQGRAAWRDSHALFLGALSARSATADADSGRRRPRTLDWLQRLMTGGQLEPRPLFPLDVYGLITNQAKVEDWRHETLPLPGALLRPGGSASALEPLTRGLELAERAGQLLVARPLNLPLRARLLNGPSPTLVLRNEILPARSATTPAKSSAQPSGVALSVQAAYWARLESPFRAFIAAISAISAISTGAPVMTVQRPSRDGGPDPDPAAGAAAEDLDRATHAWEDAVARSARAAFTRALPDSGAPARALRAASLAWARFNFCLRALIADHQADHQASPFEDAQPGAPSDPGDLSSE